MSTVSASGTLYLRDSGGLQTSTDNATWTPQTLPLTIINTDALNTTLVVLFTTAITFTTSVSYIECGSKSIQFGSTSLNAGGTPALITIANVSNYPGLIKNGGSLSAGNSDVSVCNLRVVATGTTTLDSGQGWIGHGYFGAQVSGIQVVNCRSEGPISGSSGGIVGAFAASGGTMMIRGCSSSGTIGAGGGGIAGDSAGDAGTLDIQTSYSEGSIGGSGGGLVGTNAGVNSGTVRVAGCFSLGSIAASGGGLVGDKGNATVGESYSTGAIGAGGGGIFGTNAGGTASNCYTTGTIATGAGGIFGGTYGGSTATNCYTSGTRTGADGGIYAGSATDGASNFSEAANGNSGTWSSVNAQATLSGTASVVGTVWTADQVSSPYKLSTLGFSPYSLANIVTPGYTLRRTVAQTLAAGASTSGEVISALTHSILLITATNPGTITINAATGVITTSSATPAGIYTVYVLSTSGSTYSITTFAVTVTTNGGGGGVTATAVPIGFKRLAYDQFESLVFGNRLVLERLSNVNVRFNSYADYAKYRIARSTISTK